MKLHLISFDIPWPADYGGVIDVFNRIEALSEAGVELILHSFQYGRNEAPILKELCSEVHYYKRKNRLVSFFKQDPMIVSSRASEKLLERLLKDNYPIWFEGQHTTSILDHSLLRNRKKMVRVHNIEHLYYDALSRASAQRAKAHYFSSESKKLKRHEHILKHAEQLFCITQKDTLYYQQLFDNAVYLPVAIKCVQKNYPIEDYALYHGNLSVPENSKAALWLLDNVFRKLNVPCVIAGKSPNAFLRKRIAQVENVELIENPDDEQMQGIIAKAKVHVLYTEQQTGIKLKLLNVLCTESPIVCNDKMVLGTGLEALCHIENIADRMVKTIDKLIFQDSGVDLEKRKSLMNDHSYAAHASRVMEFLD